MPPPPFDRFCFHYITFSPKTQQPLKKEEGGGREEVERMREEGGGRKDEGGSRKEEGGSRKEEGGGVVRRQE